MFPNMVLNSDIGRPRSVFALEDAMKNNNQIIFLVSQKDIKDDNPPTDDLYKVGVLAKVKNILKQSNNAVKVFVEGICRADVKEYIEDGSFVRANLEIKKDEEYEDNVKNKALVRKVQELFAEYMTIASKFSVDIISDFPIDEDMGKICDHVASNVLLEHSKKQKILEDLNPVSRAKKLIKYLSEENAILRYEMEIAKKIKDTIDDDQKNYILKEQMRVLRKELDKKESHLTESEVFLKKLKKLNLPSEVFEKLNKECENLSKIPVGTSEYNVISSYLDLCLDLPWNKSSKDVIDIAGAKKILDADHYGLSEVKERILEYLASIKFSDKLKGQIICLMGPPGVGKTSVAKSLAKAMKRKYDRISLGGVSDESEIRGHRKTYIGSMPGRIISVIKRLGVNNPLILLDEIDKISKDYRGDPASALLEALDPEQNSKFYDRYVEVPFDLSDVIFVTTANDKNEIPEPLYDRMEVIELHSYTNEEKFYIAKNHLIPKQRKRFNLTKKQFSIDDDAIRMLIDGYTKEAGVRELERKIMKLMRKATMAIVSGDKKSLNVKKSDLHSLIGAKKFINKKIDDGENVGVVNGRAWTSLGGEMLPIEVSIMSGKGDIQLTGSLGDVMRESAQLAVSYIRSNFKKLGVNENFYKNKDIHIHAPEGAVPKDGPSAGVTMFTALYSALTKKSVLSDIAMTGEITLKGRVLQIGGLKEKSMAAYKHGIKKIFLPRDNESDLEKIDKAVKDAVDFVFVDSVEDILNNAFVRKGK